ncbi:hypothetical protein HYDPIDRAFT_43999 [Hydnomerulius pinastri MD-312]|uniref:DNA 3'-5' helicase n=1 Tax=Hydnomerulius pinastri MD-312 TaxID=994086 RepID=A0A0C9W0K3_9AGAM|nr:hypothetical protein HYDPIDRAFT_43999 [Hydnomerulius pinastri MD-312]
MAQGHAPRRSKPSSIKHHSQRPPPSAPKKLSDEDVSNLKAKLTTLLGGKEPRDFQVKLAVAQEERRDVLCHAATGLGKTVVAAAPYALEHNAGKVTIMVSPLIGLQDEMVHTFTNEFKLPAIAVSSAHGGCTAEVMRDIIGGKYRIVLISPEMLVSRRFVNNVLRHSLFASRVYSVIIDEAHCVSHWGASFRKKYGTLGSIRVFLPRNTPFIAVSATLTRRVIRDINVKLQFTRSDFLFENVGNDRPNVSIIVRSIHNTMKSYTDLDFLIPATVTQLSDIKKVWVYADNISVGAEIIDYLRKKLPAEFHGAVRAYNAVLTHEYRQKAMEDFREGLIRILVCTDAAGMGCNIPDIDMVVQWKLPDKLSSFVQRAGRAARGSGKTGVAVLLVEPTAYSVKLPTDSASSVGNDQSHGPTSSKRVPPRSRRGKKGLVAKKEPVAKKKGLERDYPRAHGRYRGGRDCCDSIDPATPPALFDHSADDEGLLHLVQTTTCRRGLLRRIFDNPVSRPTVPCCDLCCPELLDNTRPGERARSSRQPRVEKLNSPRQGIVDALFRWRANMLLEEPAFSYCSYLSPSSILPDEAITTLATMKKLDNTSIQRFLEPQWNMWSRHGEDLLKVLAPFQAATTPPSHTLSQVEPPGAQPPPSQSLAAEPPPQPLASTSGSKRPPSPSFYMPERIPRRYLDTSASTLRQLTQDTQDVAFGNTNMRHQVDVNVQVLPHVSDERLQAVTMPYTPVNTLYTPTNALYTPTNTPYMPPHHASPYTPVVPSHTQSLRTPIHHPSMSVGHTTSARSFSNTHAIMHAPHVYNTPAPAPVSQSRTHWQGVSLTPVTSLYHRYPPSQSEVVPSHFSPAGYGALDQSPHSGTTSQAFSQRLTHFQVRSHPVQVQDMARPPGLNPHHFPPDLHAPAPVPWLNDHPPHPW